MTKPKFRFEKPIIKSKTEPASKNVLWYFSQLKKGLTINTIKEYIKSLGWVDLFDTAPIELEEATFTKNGIYENNEKGWDKVIVDVPPIELTSTTFTSNGLYNNPNGGWSTVIVEVPLNESGNGYIIPYTSVDSNIVTPNGLNARIIDNTYDKGLGIITFDGPVTSIAASAFLSRGTLSSVIIPNSVTSIGNDAFYGCFSLTSITIPNSVTSIGMVAFEQCLSLTSITIPESVTSIGCEAFAYCPSLTSVTCKATTPPTLESYNIMESSGVKVIYVPAESVDVYKAATNWSYYSSIIQPIPES